MPRAKPVPVTATAAPTAPPAAVALAPAPAPAPESVPGHINASIHPSTVPQQLLPTHRHGSGSESAHTSASASASGSNANAATAAAADSKANAIRRRPLPLTARPDPASLMYKKRDDDVMYKARYRTIKSLVYELEDENNLVALKVARLKRNIKSQNAALEQLVTARLDAGAEAQSRTGNGEGEGEGDDAGEAGAGDQHVHSRGDGDDGANGGGGARRERVRSRDRVDEGEGRYEGVEGGDREVYGYRDGYRNDHTHSDRHGVYASRRSPSPHTHRTHPSRAEYESHPYARTSGYSTSAYAPYSQHGHSAHSAHSGHSGHGRYASDSREYAGSRYSYPADPVRIRFDDQDGDDDEGGRDYARREEVDYGHRGYARADEREVGHERERYGMGPHGEDMREGAVRERARGRDAPDDQMEVD